MDIWALVTGIASILSLFLGSSEQFSQFKKYILPFGFISLGVFLGRLSNNLADSADMLTSNPIMLGAIIIVIASLVAGYFILKVIHDNLTVPGGVLIICFVALYFGINGIVKTYLHSFNPQKLSTYDLVELSKYKEKDGQLSDAKKYLNLALDYSDDKEEKKFINQKITKLTQQQLE